MVTTIKVPASEFKQGTHQGYVLVTSISDVLNIIPERVNPDVIQDANRRLYTPHAKAFGDYVLNTPTWVSGALLAGITADAIEYQPRVHMATFSAEDLQAAIKLFDGQHRRWGIDYSVRQAQTEIDNMVARMETTDDPEALQAEIKEKREWLEDLLSQNIIVILYVEDSIEALQQMFADISKVRAPSAETRTLFDRSDPFNVAALELSDTHPLLQGRVEMERSTLTRASTGILTLAQLSGILRTLYLGVNARQGAPARAGTAGVQSRTIYERGTEFFDAVVESSDAARAVINEDADPNDLRARGELSLNSTVLRITAAIWRALKVVKNEPTDQVVEFFRSLPHEPSTTGLWVAAGVMPAKMERATPMGRSQEARAAVSIAVAAYETAHGTKGGNADANGTDDSEAARMAQTVTGQPVGAGSR